jgi:hypothetical protein
MLVSLYQKGPEIYARSVKGWFAGWRWVFVWLTQLFFYGMPWLQWNGRQAVLFDLDAQRFYILGLVLYPQDLIFLAALLVISALALFFFTAVAGRLWCGYSCPQTVYTEIFMWVERKIEGDRIARMRLDKRAVGLAGRWPARAASKLAWLAIGCSPASASSATSRRSASWRTTAAPGRLGLERLLDPVLRRWPPTATPATCASRCASTCARTRASRAR